MSPLRRLACSSIAALALGCAPAPARLPPASPRLPRTAAKVDPPRPNATEYVGSRTRSAHAVLAFGDRTFVLLGETSPLSGGERLVSGGGWTLTLGRLEARPRGVFTLVGPGGRCRGRALGERTVTLDYGGYAGASLPARGQRAIEVEGCADLARSETFLIALGGDDPSARWQELVHVDDAPAPADAELGESEVWLHRYALGDDGEQVVERSVLDYVTPSCSEERRTVILVDGADRPLASYLGFFVRGTISTEAGWLLVLMGHDDPEALRVLDVRPGESRVALDTEIALFQDVARASC